VVVARPDPHPRLGTLAGLIFLVTSLSGCSEALSTASPLPPEPAPPVASYVALGDSFTAAPFVPTTDLADGCFRSSGNFPALLADDLDADLSDVSCSAADTGDIAGGQATAGGRGKVAPQLRAVTADTDLVTITIGGNDSGLFTALTRACTTSFAAGVPCEDRLRESFGDVAPYLDTIETSVTRTLRQVARKAPDATVVLVGYLRLSNPARDCPDFPLAPGDATFLAGVETRLNRALRDAAGAAGVEFLDMHPLARGHEICSEDPWVNGRTTDDSRALAYHPFAEGQRAVADAVAALLRG
jgi:lysophospholipase L1-like esterase